MKLLHLYPNLMNMYGDYANIKVLKKHLEDLGLKVELDEKDIGDDIDFNCYDFIYMGSGSESKLLLALNDIKNYKNDFCKCVKDNKLILFTGNSIGLLGNSINDINALSIFDFDTTLLDKRYTGDVIVKNDEIGEVVGFVNKSSQIRSNDKHRLFNYVFKDSNLNDDDYEGYCINNTYATHIIGPILVKNPNFMKFIISRLISKEDIDIDCAYEMESYNITLKALKERM